MFSFENGPDIETVRNASEFLGDTFNIWDNDSALVYCVTRGTISCRRYRYRVNDVKIQNMYCIELDSNMILGWK
jgi:uncharacterized protein YxjI